MKKILVLGTFYGHSLFCCVRVCLNQYQCNCFKATDEVVFLDICFSTNTTIHRQQERKKIVHHKKESRDVFFEIVQKELLCL